MRYRRANVTAATYFFTVNIAERQKSLLTDHVDVLRNAIKKVKQNHPFEIDAMVILPDHLHALWTLPEHDADFSMRWNLIKSGFSRELAKTERISSSRSLKGERGIWQRRFWEHLIRDDNDYERHVNYIHFNPVKHGYVDKPIDWPFSSFHRFVKDEMLPANWTVAEIDGKYGER